MIRIEGTNIITEEMAYGDYREQLLWNNECIVGLTEDHIENAMNLLRTNACWDRQVARTGISIRSWIKLFTLELQYRALKQGIADFF